MHGYLVLSARTVPTADEVFLLRVLAQQAGIAMAGVALRHALHEQTRRLGTLSARLDAADQRLAAMVAEQEHQATFWPRGRSPPLGLIPVPISSATSPATPASPSAT
jgi:hypothetical protein